MRRWLERVPDRPEIRWARAEVVLLTGDVAGARALVERMPTPTDRDRFAQHSLLTYVDWVAGSNPDFEALRVEAETVGAPGSPERLVARGQSIVARAREVAASGGDWMAPLIALRDEVGSRAEQLMREDARRGYYRALFPLGLAVSAITLMVSNLGG
jgi:hypothetical protein